MSLYTIAFLGMTPFGSLLAGALADLIGAPQTLILGGAGCLLGAALFVRRLPVLRQLVRPIYVRKGILPQHPGAEHRGAPVAGATQRQ